MRKGLVTLVLLAAGCAARVPSIDEIALNSQTQIEKTRALHFPEPVRRKTISREDFAAFLQERMARDLPPEKLEGVETTLKIFGLIPEATSLRETLLRQHQEGTAAFYDFETHTLHLLEGTPPAQLQQVMLHELVHALQDQRFDLGKILTAEREQGNTDRLEALRAVCEGEATLVQIGFDPTAAATGSPDPAAALRTRMEESLKNQEILPYFKQQILFRYAQGTRFVQDIVREKGWEAMETLYREPRLSTTHILEPFTYLRPESARRPEPIRMPPAPAGYRPLHTGTLGALDTLLVLKQFLPATPVVPNLITGWIQDNYTVYQNQSTKTPCLVWKTVWESSETAGTFLKTYVELLWKKYPGSRSHPSSTQQAPLLILPSGNLVLSESRASQVIVIENVTEDVMPKLQAACWEF
jgi:hypothetical protein